MQKHPIQLSTNSKQAVHEEVNTRTCKTTHIIHAKLDTSLSLSSKGTKKEPCALSGVDIIEAM